MANLTITAASVIAAASARKKTGLAGVAVTAGQSVYLEQATNTYKLADCNSATAAVRNAVGIALNPAAIGQTVTVAERGNVTIGATLLPGAHYYLSGTAGAICPFADLTTGDYPVDLGLAISATVLNVNIQRVAAAL